MENYAPKKILVLNRNPKIVPYGMVGHTKGGPPGWVQLEVQDPPCNLEVSGWGHRPASALAPPGGLEVKSCCLSVPLVYIFIGE